MADNLFIHIGYPKTGTTWLQEVFGLSPLLDYRHRAQWGEWVREIIFTHDFDFDPAYFLSQYLRCKEGASSKPSIILDQSFAGRPFTGGRDSCQNANRLHAIFPEGKIILCIRNQEVKKYAHIPFI